MLENTVCIFNLNTINSIIRTCGLLQATHDSSIRKRVRELHCSSFVQFIMRGSTTAILSISIALICIIGLATHVSASCPEIEAHLAACRYNRTALLSELYYTLALPGDPTHCVSASRLADAYEILVPSIFKVPYGANYDDHVFDQCDWISDGRFCAVDVEQTKCTCVVACDMLRVVRTMTESSKAYPDWANTGVPWNS